MHQLADWIISAIFTVNIQDIRAVIEWFARCDIHIPNQIQRFFSSKEIFLGNENHIRIQQFKPLLTLK